MLSHNNNVLFSWCL